MPIQANTTLLLFVRVCHHLQWYLLVLTQNFVKYAEVLVYTVVPACAGSMLSMVMGSVIDEAQVNQAVVT